MRLLKAVLGIGVIVAATCAVAGEEKATNLVSNPSFENAKDGKAPGWIFYNWAPKGMERTARGALDTSVARTGKASLRIEATGDRQFGQWQNVYKKILFAPVPVKGGKRYGVSVYVKTEISLESKKALLIFTASFRDAERKNIKADGANFWQLRERITKNSDWRRVVAVVDAPENAVGMSIALALQGCKGMAWFDDLEVIVLEDADALTPVWIEAEEYASGHAWTKVVKDEKASGGAYVEAKYVLVGNFPVPKLEQKGLPLPRSVYMKVLSKEEDGKAWLSICNLSTKKTVKLKSFTGKEWQWLKFGPFTASELGSHIHIYGGYAPKGKEAKGYVWRKAALDAFVIAVDSNLTAVDLDKIEKENAE